MYPTKLPANHQLLYHQRLPQPARYFSTHQQVQQQNQNQNPNPNPNNPNGNEKFNFEKLGITGRMKGVVIACLGVAALAETGFYIKMGILKWGGGKGEEE